MRRWGQIGPAEVMPALSHGWWKGWRGPKPLAADFRDRGRGFNVLSVYRLSVDRGRGFNVLSLRGFNVRSVHAIFLEKEMEIALASGRQSPAFAVATMNSSPEHPN